MTVTGSKRFEACWRYFNPPRKLLNASFENYIPETKQQQAAKELCQQYTIEDIKAGKGILLAGKYGTGKSHLTVAIGRELMEDAPELFGVRINPESNIYDPEIEEYRGLTCSFFSIVELLDAWRPGSEAKKKKGDWLFHRAKMDDLVILDDIGTEKATEWTFDRLYAVIDCRYSMERATIYTTNYSNDTLEKNGYGAIVSRIYGMTEQIQVIGPDHRRKRA